MQQSQPKLPFWQIWNVSFGFLGVQFGFALQNANVSRILSDLGADLHSLSLFWLVAPVMGLIIQPIVGSASDRTWNRFGRRRPFILIGAIAAAMGMLLMPNAPLFVTVMAPMLFGAVMLALMDASFNVCFQPFRSLVSDMVPASQRNIGYGVQALLINIGAVIGSLLPFILTNLVGLDNTASLGEVAPSVIWAFYLGATVLLGSVIWTVIRTKEYAPEEYARYKGLDLDANEIEKQNRQGVFELLLAMPGTMKQLAVVQFFSWFALYIMWVYTMPAITQHIWGVDKQWFDPKYIAMIGDVPSHVVAAKGAAGDWVGILFAAYSVFAAIFSVFLARLADTFGRKTVYASSLVLGGVGYLSFLVLQDFEQVHVNLLITEITVPQGAVNLIFPMIGVGIAWAAILAMPYAMLAGSLPAAKTGAYMGIFNFTVAVPQIIAGLSAGWIVSSLFDNDAINIILVAGISMLCGAIAVAFVSEVAPDINDTDKGA